MHGYALGCLINHRCSLSDVGGYLRSRANQEVKDRLLLAWARGDGRMTTMLADLKPAGSLPVARGALEESWSSPRSYTTQKSLRVLGSLGEREVLPLVQKRAGSEHTWARVYALVAAIRLGDHASADRLVAELDNLPAEWLPDFADAVAEIREPEARKALVGGLEEKQKSPDANVALAAAAIHLAWAPDIAFFRFLDALASDSAYERELASRYLAKNHDRKVTFVMRRALAREGRETTRDRLRALLDKRR